MQKHYKTLDFPFVNSSQSVLLQRGRYLFEAWGAGGGEYYCGQTFEHRGRGAYTKGEITLTKPTTFYIYVGGKGVIQTDKSGFPTFNGNYIFYHASTGGGATDFRLSKGSVWYDKESLKSRIMVAAGGGGTDCTSGGAAGKLEGEAPPKIIGKIKTGGGTQTYGGQAGQSIFDDYGTAGEFGIGGAGVCTGEVCNDLERDGGGGGGGGYFGGGGTVLNGGGGGGSSFISGYEGCNAISIDLRPTGQPIHYTGLSFNNSLMYGGMEEMPAPDGTTQIGNNGQGFARITILALEKTYRNSIARIKLPIFVFAILFINQI